jgi:hypothetical protein
MNSLRMGQNAETCSSSSETTVLLNMFVTVHYVGFVKEYKSKGTE